MYLGNGVVKNFFNLLKCKRLNLLKCKRDRRKVSDDLIYQTTVKVLRMRKETVMKFTWKWKRPDKDILWLKMSKFTIAKETEELAKSKGVSAIIWIFRFKCQSDEVTKVKEIWLNWQCQCCKGKRDHFIRILRVRMLLVIEISFRSEWESGIRND